MRKLIVSCLPALCLAAACDVVKPIEVSLRTRACNGPDPMAGVAAIRTTVFSKEFPNGLGGEPQGVNADAVLIEGVPPGSNRELVVEAMSSVDGGEVIARGSSGPMDLSSTKDTLSMSVFLRRLDTFSQTQDTLDACNGLSEARAGHTATTLADGRVLIAGGYVVEGSATRYLDSTEIYDPRSGSFSRGPSMRLKRAHHTATHIPGTSLTIIAGGENEEPGKLGGALVMAELFDEAANSFTTVKMRTARTRHAVAAPSSGTGVLLIGGSSYAGSPLDNSEVFNPQTRAFEDGPALASPRTEAAAVALPGGAVLLVGGWNGTAVVSSTELFQQRPSSSTFDKVSGWKLSLTGSGGKAAGTIRPSLAAIGDRQVLVTGGHTLRDTGTNNASVLSAVSTTFLIDVPDDAAQAGRATSYSLGQNRSQASAVSFFDGSVLVAGGHYAEGTTVRTRDGAEFFVIDGKGALTSSPTSTPMTSKRAQAAFAVLLDGTVLVTGGREIDGATTNFLASAEIYQPPYATGASAYR